jgi:lipopolysaccharide export LptBFGC system permease protein LptF
VPQAVPVALPVGLFIGLLYGFRSSVPSLRSRTLVTAVAIVCSISSFVALAWIVPVSNQAFRVAALEDRFVTKGAPEMTLRELRTRITAETTKGRTAPGLAHHYHFRWALAAAPLVLAAWALLIVPRLPDRRWVAGIVAVASSVGYYTLIDAGRVGVINGALPPIAGAWLANAAFVAALVLLARRTSNARTTNGAV